MSLCPECRCAKIYQISIYKPRCAIRLVEEIARRRKLNVTRKYISRPTDVAVIYLLKSILKDLFNTEMWNCNEIARSFQLLVNNATRTVIQSAMEFPNSNIAIDFAETSLMLKKYVEVYLSIIKPTVK